MLINLAAVSRTLVNVIREHIHHLPIAANPWITADVSALPPDRLRGNQAVGFYLYYVSEDAHFKNLESTASAGVPVSYMPMGLQLHYVLTAVCQTESAAAPLTEQSLFGFALKALHDHPKIEDSTLVGGVPVMDTELMGRQDRFRVVLEPIPVRDAIQYWTAGSQPLRLAAYYQVSVVLLEPEEPETSGGRVLSIGLEAFLHGSPRLERSRSIIAFTPPGFTARQVDVSPAQATYGAEIRFEGNDLAGDETRLLVRDSSWNDFLEAASEWGVASDGQTMRAVVQPFLGGRPILPGMYTAAAKVIHRRPQSGTIREFIGTSNVTAFVVTPAIDTVSAPDPAGIVTVTGRRFLLAPEIVPERDLGLYIGPSRFTLRTSGPLLPGEFSAAQDIPAAGTDTVQFRFPGAGLVPGQMYPLRLLVRGSENAPLWVEAV